MPADAHAEALDSLRAEIEGLVERVDELIVDVLREAVHAGASERPDAERRLSRVRSALQRAIVILEGGQREGRDRRDERDELGEDA